MAGPLPSGTKTARAWRTREDPFEGLWATEVVPRLAADTERRLQTLTLFEWLCERYPGRFRPGQVRTLQRRVRDWRAQHGPDVEAYFEQTACARHQSPMCLAKWIACGSANGRHRRPHCRPVRRTPRGVAWTLSGSRPRCAGHRSSRSARVPTVRSSKDAVSFDSCFNSRDPAAVSRRPENRLRTNLPFGRSSRAPLTRCKRHGCRAKQQ